MDVSTLDIDQLAAMEFSKSQSQITAEDAPRIKAVREAACSLGARAGLMKGSRKILDWMEDPSTSRELDEAYEFGSLMLDNGVLPPVISYSTKLVTQSGGYSIRSAGEQYTIVSPARFTTITPTWRDWLMMGLLVSDPNKQSALAMPPDVLLAKTPIEKSIWDESIRKCWSEGVEQSKSIFNLNRDRLIRDWFGMARYKTLVASGAIDQPAVKSVIESVIRKPQELTIDDVSREITRQPTFNSRTSVAVPVAPAPQQQNFFQPMQ